MNQSPEDTDANTTKFLTEYFQTFEFICQHLKIASPWESIESFKALALRRRYVSMFVWLFVSYIPCVCTPKVGWLGLYSDMSKVGNVNLHGREIDKHDEISG